jgi:hypothetical protein
MPEQKWLHVEGSRFAWYEMPLPPDRYRRCRVTQPCDAGAVARIKHPYGITDCCARHLTEWRARSRPVWGLAKAAGGG